VVVTIFRCVVYVIDNYMQRIMLYMMIFTNSIPNVFANTLFNFSKFF